VWIDSQEIIIEHALQYKIKERETEEDPTTYGVRHMKLQQAIYRITIKWGLKNRLNIDCTSTVKMRFKYLRKVTQWSVHQLIMY